MRDLFTIVSHPCDMQRIAKEARAHNKKIGFVPTMGYLHEGHISLIEQAKQYADFVVVSIFVNPTQFNNPQDLETYPVDRDRDCAILAEHHIATLFTPNAEDMYAQGFQNWIEPGALAAPHEGADRPGHFRGVATVVTKLFNIINPDVAVFGEKDFQQLRVIEQLVSDLNIPTEVLRGATVRESDGLAMSSRNSRLSPAARGSACKLSKALSLIANEHVKGEKNCGKLREIAHHFITSDSSIAVNYLEIVDEQTLRPIKTTEDIPYPRVLIAATIGGVRLIDNLALRIPLKAA